MVQSDTVQSTDKPLVAEQGLSALEIDRRLVALAKQNQRIEASLCFYLREVDDRRLYQVLGFARTVDYARERLGFEERKTRALLRMALRFDVLPKIRDAFARGELPWTKVREALKIASPQTEDEWLEKCRSLSNRQLEREVRKDELPARTKVLTIVLKGDQVDAWEQTREALERLSGMALTDAEVFELMTAEVLCTYATTPPFGACSDEKGTEGGGYLRLVAERDSWVCQRPGCTSRTGLQGHHIASRAKGGTDDPVNILVLCAICHQAVTSGRLRVSGCAPDGLTWSGPDGVIEKPLPLDLRRRHDDTAEGKSEGGDLIREHESVFGLTAALAVDWQSLSDHVIRDENRAHDAPARARCIVNGGGFWVRCRRPRKRHCD